MEDTTTIHSVCTCIEWEQMQLLSTVNRDISYIEAQLQANIEQVELSKGAWAKAKKADNALRSKKQKRADTFGSIWSMRF